MQIETQSAIFVLRAFDFPAARKFIEDRRLPAADDGRNFQSATAGSAGRHGQAGQFEAIDDDSRVTIAEIDDRFPSVFARTARLAAPPRALGFNAPRIAFGQAFGYALLHSVLRVSFCSPRA